MFNELRDRDWEMLSAYMDGQLSSVDRAAVEKRLQSNTKFNDAFRSLRRTRVILKETSLVKRRRNFYLTPEMVKPNPWGWLVPILNYSSLAAGLLAIMLFVMDIVPSSGIVPRPANISAAPTIMERLPEVVDLAAEGQTLEAARLPNLPASGAQKVPGTEPEGRMSEPAATSMPSPVGSENSIQGPVEIRPSAEEGMPMILSVTPEVEGLSEMPAPMMKSAPEAMEDQNAVPDSMEAFSAPAPPQETWEAEVPVPDNLQEIVTPETLPTTIEQGAFTNPATPSASIEDAANENPAEIPLQEITREEFTDDFAPQGDLPIRPTENWLRIGWIILLLASGILAFISLSLRIRERK